MNKIKQIRLDLLGYFTLEFRDILKLVKNDINKW